MGGDRDKALWGQIEAEAVAYIKTKVAVYSLDKFIHDGKYHNYQPSGGFREAFAAAVVAAVKVNLA